MMKPEWTSLNKHAYLHVDGLTHERKWMFMPMLQVSTTC